jgi:hypothetical protein
MAGKPPLATHVRLGSRASQRGRIRRTFPSDLLPMGNDKRACVYRFNSTYGIRDTSTRPVCAFRTRYSQRSGRPPWASAPRECVLEKGGRAGGSTRHSKWPKMLVNFVRHTFGRTKLGRGRVHPVAETRKKGTLFKGFTSKNENKNASRFSFLAVVAAMQSDCLRLHRGRLRSLRKNR